MPCARPRLLHDAMFVLVTTAACLTIACKSTATAPLPRKEPLRLLPHELRPRKQALQLVRHKLRRTNPKEADCEYEVEYLQIQGLTNPIVQRRLNGRLVRTAKLPSCKSGDDGDEGVNTAVMCGTTVTFKRTSLENTRVLALLEQRYGDCCGCPHGIRTIRCHVYSLETGDEFAVDRLFRLGFRAALAAEVARMLSRKQRKDFRANAQRYLRRAGLCLEADGVDIVFPDYALGRTFVEGGLEVRVDYCRLRQWIAPTSPLRSRLVRCRKG